MEQTKQNNSSAIGEGEDAEWLGIVRDKVSRLQYGSVQIIVHEGRVTQVESIERTRLATDRKVQT
jgi:hypothetical protein